MLSNLFQSASRAVVVATLMLWTDAGQALELRLLDAATQRPLKEASVEWRLGTGQAQIASPDQSGRVQVSVPADAAGELRVIGRKTGFSPITMTWDARSIPATFDLRLAETQELGGRILDDSGQPVAGAEVALIIPQRIAGPRVSVDDLSVKSDSAGRWRCFTVPKDSAYVHVEVLHPDYLSSDRDVTLDALRSGTAEHKLLPVATIRGRVLDEAGQAIRGAQVVLGREHDIWPSRDTLETLTDAKGVFEFRRVALAKRLLGVKADSAAPELRLVEVTRKVPSLEVRLTRGTPLRVRVMDTSGQPIPGVEATVNEWSSDRSGGTRTVQGRWSYPG